MTNIIKHGIISQSNFLPWRGYFAALRIADILLMYDGEQFTRRDWRNRNVIQSGEKREWLTLAVKNKGNYYAPINQIEIVGSESIEKLIKKISHSYREYKTNSGFAFVKNLLQSVSQESSLSSINSILTKRICEYLGIDIEIIQFSADSALTEKNMKLIEGCQKFGISNYLTGPSALSYLDLELFARNNIAVELFNFDKLLEPKIAFEYSIVHHIITNDLHELERITSFGSGYSLK